MFARIFKPSKTAMQSGKGKSGQWVLEFEPSAARRTDPLMGWTSSEDTTATQVRLTFETKDEAIAYAEKHEIAFRVSEEKKRTAKPKAYSDNFAFKRRQSWTH